MVGMMEQLLQNWPPPPTEEELAAMRAREIAARRLRGERLPPRTASIWDAQPEQQPGPFSAMPPRYAPDPLEVEANRIQPGGWMGPQGTPGGGGISLGWLKELLSSINPQGALAGKPAGNFDPMNMRGAAQAVGNALTKPEAPVDPALAAEAAGIKPGGWVGGPPPDTPPIGMVPNGMPPAPSVLDAGAKPVVAGPTTPPTAVTSLDGGAIPLPRPDPRRNTEMGSRAVAAQEPGAPLSLAPAQAAQGLPPELQAAGKGGLNFRMPSPAMLFALASGFAGAPSFGTGMRRAFGGAAGVAAQDELTRSKQDLTGSSKADIYRSLVAKGVPPADALAAVNNPKVMEQVSKQYYGTEDKKPPTVRDFKLPDGTIMQQQWDPKAGWQPVKGFEKPVPGSNRERTLSINDIEKMSAEGQKLAQVTGFHSAFKDQFGGYMSGTVGDLANTYGRNVPWASEDSKERANWWQGYQMHKNEVRNKMFGSALTAQESAEWAKADINPGMSPDLIRRNLARQQRILEQATRRKADAAIEAGFPAKSIYTVFGIAPLVAPAASGKTKGGVSWSVMGGGGEGAPSGGSGTNAPAADDNEE